MQSLATPSIWPPLTRGEVCWLLEDEVKAAKAAGIKL